MFQAEMKLIQYQLINEYAGYFDHKGIIDAFPSNRTFNDADEFYYSMTKYLNQFHDPHLLITQNSSLSVNIRVQLHEDKLYVVESKNEKISNGSIIEQIGDFTIKEILNIDHELLKSTNPERMVWTDILKKYKNVTINSIRIDILTSEKVNFFPQVYTIEQREQYLYIRFSDFIDTIKIHQIINQHKQIILNANSIIIDVRGNRGGSDLSFLSLLPLLTNKTINLKEDYPYYHRFTKLYCDDRLAAISSLLEQDIDNNSAEDIIQFKKMFEVNYNKGMVNINDHSQQEHILGVRDNLPDIKVLCDFECGSSGDSFIEFIKKFNNAEIIGRPTRGMNDYSNIVMIELDSEFKLYVPHSKDGKVDYGKGMAQNGIPVHHYIPWQVEEIERDIILEIAESKFS